MPRKKKIVENKDVKDVFAEEITDYDIVNPGDCCGNYLEDDESCKLCEIQDTCKEMTEDLKNGQ